jgi:hypothetical protein
VRPREPDGRECRSAASSDLAASGARPSGRRLLAEDMQVVLAGVEGLAVAGDLRQKNSAAPVGGCYFSAVPGFPLMDS